MQAGLGDQARPLRAAQPGISVRAGPEMRHDRVDRGAAAGRQQHGHVQVTGLAADRPGQAAEHLLECLLVPRFHLAGQHQCHRLPGRPEVLGGCGLAVHSNQ
jgi:hypothetical protein